MTKFCRSCGAANAETANVCIRCGKSLYVGGGGVDPVWAIPVSGHNKKRIIIIVLFTLLTFLVLYQFIGKGRIPKLTEEECKEIFSDAIKEEEIYLRNIFDPEKEQKVVNCSIMDIEQDGKNAVVTLKLSAKYNYADCDLVCRCNSVYIDTTETWTEGSYERESHWNYHDLEGIWQEKDWHRSMVTEFDSGPSTLLVEKIADGYRFTATANWVDDYQDTQKEVKMTDLNSDTLEFYEGGTKLFPKGYMSESYFQCYNLSPEEGITDMEKTK